LSRNERPVIAIGAVGEGLLPCDQSSSTRKTRNPAAGPRVNFDSWPEVFYHGGIALGQGLVFFARVIEGAVQFNVMKLEAVGLSDAFQCADLLQEKQFKLARPKLHAASS